MVRATSAPTASDLAFHAPTMTATPVPCLALCRAAEFDKLASAVIVEKPDVPDTCLHAIAVAPKALNAFTDQAKGRALQ